MPVILQQPEIRLAWKPPILVLDHPRNHRLLPIHLEHVTEDVSILVEVLEPRTPAEDEPCG